MKLLLLLIIFISACASNERLARVSVQEEQEFNCADIQRELKVAEEILINIDSDPMEPSMGEALLAIPFLIAERLDVSDAEEHAEKRIADLEALQVTKSCSIPQI
ncbi:MAG: hypothetical protein H8E32_00155 [Nitrospinae bacterium]|nr:hypothetical protein [Nitrospinota bacterium]